VLSGTGFYPCLQEPARESRFIHKGSIMSVAKSEINIKNIRTLIFKSEKAVRIVSLITLYRIVTFPILIFLILIGEVTIFKWLLLASFFTDAIDGYIARKYHATSILGAKLDSIGDDLTILAAVIGLIVNRTDFIKKELILLLILFGLFAIQLTVSLIKYKKISSFHTYLAKTAAVVTALFLLSVFFVNDMIYPLFYAAYIITLIELIEEIIIVFILPNWKANVKGIYWILKNEKV
jgi:phosphatidylglycerophosphate synthase